ncbi:uncharacterized protein LOC127123788 [Lathyrus oleraceus]|uniref:uncharacterized protein LOC127123788 n=1 Tax=Pisum sativum TaxID=3888 RepID=UPI0021D234C9|nr:uncharacterized protein LOC127123788 [Pisum sativum]
MEDALWKDLVKRLNFLISREITLIPTPTIPDGKITRILDGSFKDVETSFELITNRGENEIVEEDLMEKEELMTEREESKNQGDQEEIGATIEQLIDKNSSWRRTKKQILNYPNPELPDYIKPPYLIIKKKPLQEDEVKLFTKFKEMLATFQVSISFHEILELIPKFAKFMLALLKDTKPKLVKEQVNMIEKDETAVPQSFPPKMTDLGKFTIACTSGGVKIPHTLCHLWSNINVMLMNKFKELKLGETIPSNMTLTLADSSITHLLGIVQDVLVHVDGLVFPAYFIVTDMKGDSRRLVILRCPFLAIGKALIDVETCEIVLKFNKEKVMFNVY